MWQAVLAYISIAVIIMAFTAVFFSYFTVMNEIRNTPILSSRGNGYCVYMGTYWDCYVTVTATELEGYPVHYLGIETVFATGDIVDSRLYPNMTITTKSGLADGMLYPGESGTIEIYYNTTNPKQILLSDREYSVLSYFDKGTLFTRFATPPSTVIGLIAGRTQPTTDNRSIDPSETTLLSLYIEDGALTYEYVTGGNITSQYVGVFTLLTNDTLDLSSLTLAERKALGPVVVFYNPYNAASNYTVHIKSIYGVWYNFTLAKIVDNPDDVVWDILVCWEDTWSPTVSNPNALDNYVDEVFRITKFTNNTYRIEPMHGSGYYLHIVLLNPGTDLLSIAKDYAVDYRLPPSSGAVYVKVHNGVYGVNEAVQDYLWNPVTGGWMPPTNLVLYVRGSL